MKSMADLGSKKRKKMLLSTHHAENAFFQICCCFVKFFTGKEGEGSGNLLCNKVVPFPARNNFCVFMLEHTDKTRVFFCVHRLFHAWKKVANPEK